MRKSLLILVLLLLVSFVSGNHNEVSVSFDKEYTVLEDGVLYYNLTIHQNENVTIGYTDKDDNDTILYTEFNPSPSDIIEVGGRIVHTFNHTGVYSVFKTIDDDKRYVGSLEVVDRSFPAFVWFMIGISVLSGLFALLVLPTLWILSGLTFTTSLISLFFHYKYVFDDNVFLGLISLSIFAILSVVVIVSVQLIKRN